MTFSANDVQIPAVPQTRRASKNKWEVALWYVQGSALREGGVKTYYPTRATAEVAARQEFPSDWQGRVAPSIFVGGL